MTLHVDYDERQHAVYAEARSLTPERAELWSRVFARYIEEPLTILDLGSGVGTYSVLLAEAFDATVVGVEPSARMREVATRAHAHPNVRYLDGSGERIPLGDGSCGAALLSYVIHHLRDRDASVVELRRVLRDRGVVLIRSALRDSLSKVPFFEFFPAARGIDERRMPSAREVVSLFTGNGFEHAASEAIQQETAASLREYHDRLKLRGISTLELLSDAEFEEGIERLRRAAEQETKPRPVTAQVDLLVFRRR